MLEVDEIGSMSNSRSQNMARIRASDTGPEILLRRRLWASGLRYRVNYRTPGGRADIAVPSERFAVFVDGCFWHGCPDHYVCPRSASPFWSGKLRENFQRDRRQTQSLLGAGWRVARIWEHEINEELPVIAEKVLSVYRREKPHIINDFRVVLVEAKKHTDRELRHLQSLLDPRWRRTEEGPRVTRKVGPVPRTLVFSSEVEEGPF